MCLDHKNLKYSRMLRRPEFSSPVKSHILLIYPSANWFDFMKTWIRQTSLLYIGTNGNDNKSDVWCWMEVLDHMANQLYLKLQAGSLTIWGHDKDAHEQSKKRQYMTINTKTYLIPQQGGGVLSVSEQWTQKPVVFLCPSIFSSRAVALTAPFVPGFLSELWTAPTLSPSQPLAAFQRDCQILSID